jgi:AbrB family transcriptional regulator (stage V sporulation protein T)
LKATGIVRRIDELGRVVIPKEIRRTLKIREGDPLEIFTDKEGEIILKKYSPIGELGDFAMSYAETLSKTSGHIACICDRDQIIAVYGAPKKEYVEKNLSEDIEKLIGEKAAFLKQSESENSISILQAENDEQRYTAIALSSIVSEGDPIGAVILMSTEHGAKMGEVESKLVQAAAGFLGRQMEQ